MASVLCSECGDVLSFQKSCSDKFCDICNERRRKRLMRDYQKEIEKMEHPKFLTLTLKSQELSRDLLRRIRLAFTRMTHRKKWLAKGGFYVIELGSLKDNGLWNIHIHAVMDSEYMPQGWISKVWLESTGDSMVVDIRQVRSYRYAIWYLTKYVGKPIEMNREMTEPERNYVNAVLKGSRLIQRFGNCIHVRIEKHKTICRKCGAINSYISVEIELLPSIRAFDKTRGFKDCRCPRAEAIESYDWWTFESD